MHFLILFVMAGAAFFIVEGTDRLTNGEVYLASLQLLAQEATAPLQQTLEETPKQPLITEEQPKQPIQVQEEPVEEKEEFVDPREVRDATRQIKQLKADLKRFTTQLKKLANNADDLAVIEKIRGELDQILAVLANKSASGSELREALQDFYSNEYWEQANVIRAKLELPREIKQITTSLKRVERVLKAKATKTIGIDVEKTQQAVEEMKRNLEEVSSQYKNGNLEAAMEAMQFFHEGGHPGEIEGTIFRLRDIKNQIKRIKDATVRAEIENVLREVIDEFNQGNYRDAREILDEYADDIMRLIKNFMRTKAKVGDGEQQFSKIRDLDGLIQQKLNEKEQVRVEKQAPKVETPVESPVQQAPTTTGQ